MKRQTTLTHEFVEYIPDELKDGTLYVLNAVRNRGSQMLLRMRQEGGNAVKPNGLEADFRRQIDFARPVDRKLEL
jgi:S-adenosylmethionine:tRNA-ribosyltransferase-isomerase (queuine synthetase)